ncbi:polysialyltransferase family glycosyltransferase [Glutamicibacter creatinolyticus]|uniref:polysialyltransferase family glycosyltransferase n=1 Tax=Glutamicibacter creatinolyticus TaxID=162496 RepID=UPI0037BFF0ED
MIQLLTASTSFQVMCLAAMLDAGLLPPAERRILVLANGSMAPELTVPLDEVPGFPALAERFDAVVDFGALIAPRRVGAFNPRTEELVTFERLLRTAWGLGREPVHLVLESIQVNPAQALARIFHDAPITVHSDGLMSYGPTRSRLPRPIAQRIAGTCHVDLVPGLRPLLLHELCPRRTVVPLPALRRVFDEVARDPQVTVLLPRVPADHALVLGQYLGALGLLDDEQELELHRQMLQEAADCGAGHVVFKPHPSSSPASARRLAVLAAQQGLGFTLLRTPLLGETVIGALRPQRVISCFSTALVTAHYMLDIPVSAVGTDALLQHLAPYQNSNRIPLTLIHALFRQQLPAPSRVRSGSVDELSALVRAVSYCMQSGQLESLRAQTEEYLEGNYAAHPEYFKRRRLAKLDLPPRWAHPNSQRSPVLRLRRAAGRSVRGMQRRGARAFSSMARRLESGARG